MAEFEAWLEKVTYFFQQFVTKPNRNHSRHSSYKNNRRRDDGDGDGDDYHHAIDRL